MSPLSKEENDKCPSAACTSVRPCVMSRRLDCDEPKGILSCCRTDPCSLSSSSKAGVSSEPSQLLSWWPGRSCLRSTLQSAGSWLCPSRLCAPTDDEAHISWYYRV